MCFQHGRLAYSVSGQVKVPLWKLQPRKGHKLPASWLFCSWSFFFLSLRVTCFPTLGTGLYTHVSAGAIYVRPARSSKLRQALSPEVMFFQLPKGRMNASYFKHRSKTHIVPLLKIKRSKWHAKTSCLGQYESLQAILHSKFALVSYMGDQTNYIPSHQIREVGGKT